MVDSAVRHRLTICLLLIGLLAGAVAGSEAAGAADDIVLFGQVTDESGAAIVGATVVARAERSIHQRAVDELAGESPKILAESTTNAKGTYFLRVDPGAYEVEATAEGRASRHIHLLPVAETFQLEPAALPAGGTFRVNVRADDGEPAVGAYVTGLSDDGTRQQGQWHARTARVQTDETGAATLAVDRDKKVNLRVVAEDGSFFYRDGLEGRSADVTLEAGTEWTVRVEDPRGNALSGVLVHLTTSRIPVARTGEDGTFHTRLPEKPMTVALRLTHDDGRYHRAEVGDDPGDETKQHVFTLDDPVAVSGRVLDALSGEAVAGALVWPFRRPYDAVLTDRSGGFQMPPRPGPRWFQAAARGYGEGSVDLRRQQEPAEPVIRLPPATRLVGRVSDPGGQGIAGVELVATIQPGPGQPYRSQRSRRAQAGRTRTGEDGSFTLDRLFPDAAYELQATRSGFAPARQRTTTLRPPEVAEVELTMEPGVQAVGLVVDEADQPLAGATVELHPPPPDPAHFGRRYYSQSPDVFSSVSGENGEFTVADVARGTYRIEVRRPGFARTVVPGVEISDELVFETATESGESRLEADLGVIVLVPGVSLDGLVVDADDQPIEGAQVTAHLRSDSMGFRPRSTDGPMNQTSDAEGRFRLVDLTPEERLDLQVLHEGHAGIRLPGVQPPTDEPVRIVLERTGVVRGRVVDEDFAPVADVTVHTSFENVGASLRFASGPDHDQTDVTGAFELKNVPPGAIVLAVGEPTWKIDDPPRLELAPGEIVDDVEIRVSRSIVLSGSVRGPNGESAAHCEISLSWKTGITGSHSTSRQADSEGRFEFGGIEEGEVTVTAQHASLGFARKIVKVAAPGARVDLVLEAGGEVAGQVLGPEGEPASAATVMLQNDPDAHSGMAVSFNSDSARTDGDGRFRFVGVADGTYRLTADHPDYAQSQSDSFEVAGSQVERRLELGRGAVVTGRLEGLDFEQLGATQVSGFSALGLRRQGIVRHDATYSMKGMAEGTWYLQAQSGDQMRSEQLVLKPGETEASVDFDFSGGFDLEGRLQRDGESLVGAQVMVNSLDKPGQHHQAQSDFEGRFRLSGLEDGSYILQVFSQDGFRHHREIDIPHPGPLDIHVRTSDVEGVVRSADGAPLAGAKVTAQRVAEVDPTSAASLFSRFADQNSANADSSGTYRLARLPEGRWTLTASHDGFAQAESEVQLVQGGDLLGFDFALEPVQGLWLDLLPAPGINLPPQVAVAVLSPSGEQHSVVHAAPGEGGAVHLPSLPAGTWRLAVAVPGAATAYVLVQAPDDRPSVSLAPEAKLQLSSPELDTASGIQQATITRADGFVHLPLLAGHLLPAWPLIPGKSEIGTLPAGTWTVEVGLPDGLVLRGTATVQPGETATVVLAP